jgi:hypothetical protein
MKLIIFGLIFILIIIISLKRVSGTPSYLQTVSAMAVRQNPNVTCPAGYTTDPATGNKCKAIQNWYQCGGSTYKGNVGTYSSADGYLSAQGDCLKGCLPCLTAGYKPYPPACNDPEFATGKDMCCSKTLGANGKCT